MLTKLKKIYNNNKFALLVATLFIAVLSASCGDDEPDSTNPTNPMGPGDPDSIRLVIQDDPVCTVNADSDTGKDVSCTVTVSVTPEGTDVTYEWDFGVEGTENDTSTDQNPEYTYANEGNYTVEITVSAGEGDNAVTRRTSTMVSIIDFAKLRMVLSDGTTAGSSRKWVINRRGTALGVGPGPPSNPLINAGLWWSFNRDSLHLRPCLLDDEYTFEVAADGSGKFVHDTMWTFFRDTMGNGGHKSDDAGPEGCVEATGDNREARSGLNSTGQTLWDIFWAINRTDYTANPPDMPADIYEYRNKSGDTDRGGYTYTLDKRTLTLNGRGSYLALQSKSNAGDQGYLVPETRVFTIRSLAGDGSETDPYVMVLQMDWPGGVWTFNLFSYNNDDHIPDVPRTQLPPAVEPTMCMGEAGRLMASDLPVTFESPTYPFSHAIHEGDNRLSVQCVANPNMTGNASAQVLRIEDTFQFVNKTVVVDRLAGSDVIPLDGKCGITMLAYNTGTANVSVQLELEGTDVPTAVQTVSTTMTNAWETLNFDLSDIVFKLNQAEYNRIILILNPGTDDTATLLVDNVDVNNSFGDCLEQTPMALAKIDFEGDCAEDNGIPGAGDDGDGGNAARGFGRASGTCVAPPSVPTGNTSTMVLQNDKADGAEIWAGIEMFRTPKTQPLKVSDNCGFKMRVLNTSNAAIPLKFKLEINSNNGVNLEKDVSIPNNANWQNFSIDLSSGLSAVNEGPASYDVFDSIVLFLDFGNTAQQTVYIDDFEVDTSASTCTSAPALDPPPAVPPIETNMCMGAAGRLMASNLPVTFESPTYPYSHAIHEGGGTELSVKCFANPMTTGANTSTQVLQIADTNQWFNKTVVVDELAGSDVIPLTGSCGITMQTYNAGSEHVPVQLELEGTGVPTAVKKVNTTMMNAWETLSFDLSDIVTTATQAEYNRIILILNPGTDDAATLLVDNVGVASSFGNCLTPVALSTLTFQGNCADDNGIPAADDGGNAARGFGSGSASCVDTPVGPTGNSSTKVLQNVKTGAPNWSGIELFRAAAPLLLSDNCGFKMKVLNTAGGELPLTLKLEVVSNTGISLEKLAPIPQNANWQEVSIDLSSGLTAVSGDPANYDLFDSIILFLDLSSEDARTIHIDDFAVDTSLSACSGAPSTE